MEPVIEPVSTNVPYDYEQLYINEKNKKETVETILLEKNREIEKLLALLKSKETEVKELKVQVLSYINSQTAKRGFEEEALLCNDLNNETIKKSFIPILGDEYDECSKINGNHKCDIRSNDHKLKAQVKKYKYGQFQQIDRHWVTNMIEKIPQLRDALQILENLVEIPLLPNGTHVDKTKSVKKLCTSNYSQKTLDDFLVLLNRYKRLLLEYAFLGTHSEMRPDFLFGVEYKAEKRTKIVVFKIKEIIDYLDILEFKISPKKTAISLGDGHIFSLQRKGGDGGRKSSNQLQMKFILSGLIGKVVNVQYELSCSD